MISNLLRLLALAGSLLLAVVVISLALLRAAEPPIADNEDRSQIRDPQTPEETKSLHGRVTDLEGKPIADVRVALYGGDWYDRDQTLGQETRTDKTGEYRFEKSKLWTKYANRPMYFSQVRFEHPQYTPSDGRSVHHFERQSKASSSFLKRLDMQMQLGGKLSGTVTSKQTGKPLANARLRLRDGFLKGRRSDEGDDFIARLDTNEKGKFSSPYAIPAGRYHVEIDRRSSDPRSRDLFPPMDTKDAPRYPKIGIVEIEAGKEVTAVLSTQELPVLQNPYIIQGVARGNDGELMIGCYISPRADGGRTKLRFQRRHTSQDGKIRFQLGPVKRVEVSDSSPYGIEEVDFDFVGQNERQHYKLVAHIPAEPIVLTDDPTKPEVENGIRYLRPGVPATFEFIFARTDDVDNTVKTNSLVVKTVDQAGAPVPLVGVSIYDRNGETPVFQPSEGRTNLSGLATFPNSVAMWSENAVVVEVNNLPEPLATLIGNFVVLEKQEQVLPRDPLASVEKDDDGNVIVTLVMPRRSCPVSQKGRFPRVQSSFPKIILTVLGADGQPARDAIVSLHVSPKRVRDRKVPVYSTDAQGQVEFDHDNRFHTTRYSLTHKTGSTVYDLADYLKGKADDAKRLEIKLPPPQ